MFRVILGFNRVVKFDVYSKALDYKNQHGGILYQKVYG